MIIFIFASILSFLFFFLSFGVIKQRRFFKIALGDNDNIEIKKWIRAQSNFTEYTPFTLMLLFFLEYSGANKIEIAILGTLFTIGRFVHAYGLIKEEKYENGNLTQMPRARRTGMKLTFLIIIYCAFRLILTSLS